MNGKGPVDPYGWTGPGADPYTKDLGDLWLTGSPKFANVPLPSVTLTAELDFDHQNAINVSWASPAGASANYTIYYVAEDGVKRAWGSPVGNGSGIFYADPGRRYWFWAVATTDLGWSDAGGSPVVRLPSLHPKLPVEV
jgi:hypothetical protein